MGLAGEQYTGRIFRPGSNKHRAGSSQSKTRWGLRPLPWGSDHLGRRPLSDRCATFIDQTQELPLPT